LTDCDAVDVDTIVAAWFLDGVFCGAALTDSTCEGEGVDLPGSCDANGGWDLTWETGA